MCEGIIENKHGIVLGLNVSPGKGKFEVTGFSGGKLKLKTRSRAQKGLANREIEKELKGIFNAKVEILKGFKSRDKTIIVKDLSKKELLKLLECL